MKALTTKLPRWVSVCILTGMVVLALGVSKTLTDTQRFAEVARRGNLERACLMLAVDPELARSRDVLGNSPLRWAARFGHADVVALLLAKGAEVKTRDGPVGDTPLLAAATGGHVQVMWLLLRSGADPNAKESNRYGGMGYTSLHWGAAKGNVEMVDLLLSHGAAVDPLDQRGRTPLHVATAGCHISVMESLIAGGADLSAADARGETVLHIATRIDSPECLAFLLKQPNCPPVNQKSNDGKTPLQLAEQCGRSQNVAILRKFESSESASN